MKRRAVLAWLQAKTYARAYCIHFLVFAATVIHQCGRLTLDLLLALARHQREAMERDLAKAETVACLRRVMREVAGLESADFAELEALMVRYAGNLEARAKGPK